MAAASNEADSFWSGSRFMTPRQGAIPWEAPIPQGWFMAGRWPKTGAMAASSPFLSRDGLYHHLSEPLRMLSSSSGSDQGGTAKDKNGHSVWVPQTPHLTTEVLY